MYYKEKMLRLSDVYWFICISKPVAFASTNYDM